MTDKLMREAADTHVASGMADFGYEYVNIDDCWMVKPGSTDPDLGGEPRTAAGDIRDQPQLPRHECPDRYIHAQGTEGGNLHLARTARRAPGTRAPMEHEEADARQFARWGFDFLKYDWCSYQKIAASTSVEEAPETLPAMGELVRNAQSRHGVQPLPVRPGRRLEMGRRRGRPVAGAPRAIWGIEKDADLPGFYTIAFENAEHFEYAGPGRWNDPDYILIGPSAMPTTGVHLPGPTTLTPTNSTATCRCGH